MAVPKGGLRKKVGYALNGLRLKASIKKGNLRARAAQADDLRVERATKKRAARRKVLDLENEITSLKGKLVKAKLELRKA